MKKILISLLLLAMCVGSCAAMAESGRIDDILFNTAKQTLYCIDTGDYRTASALLGCVDSETLQQLATQSFTTLGSGTAQTRISVAFFYNGLWYLAVPTAEPSGPEVEVLLMDCGSDGTGFQKVYYTLWANVQSVLDLSEAMIWNEEYVPGVQIIGN